MTGVKTNERPGTRAQHRYARLSAYKARVVLDLIRGKTIAEADEILAFVERDAADVIRKVLDSAIANAEHNDEIPADELFVSACYADEGPTLKRWRPRARGRATRIRKRTCHITIIVSRLSADEIARMRAAADEARERRSGQGATARAATDAAEARRRRVAKSRQDDTSAEESDDAEEIEAEELVEDEAIEAEVEAEAALEDTSPEATDDTSPEASADEDEAPADATEIVEEAAADAEVPVAAEVEVEAEEVAAEEAEASDDDENEKDS
jgi:large subunit ribosomal protein L22